MSEKYAHVKGVRRYAFAALGLATLSGLWISFQADGSLLGIDVSPTTSMAILLLGLAIGAVGITRRSDAITGIAAGALVLGVLPAGIARPGIGAFALGVLFGLALLVMLELVHMTQRYARAYAAVERDNVPESHINRVTDEAFKTLASRAFLAALGVALAIGIAHLLAAFGPHQWRAAVETAAPLGVAIIALILAGLAGLLILTRGASLRWRRPRPDQEVSPDVAE